MFSGCVFLGGFPCCAAAAAVSGHASRSLLIFIPSSCGGKSRASISDAFLVALAASDSIFGAAVTVISISFPLPSFFLVVSSSTDLRLLVAVSICIGVCFMWRDVLVVFWLGRVLG